MGNEKMNADGAYKAGQASQGKPYDPPKNAALKEQYDRGRNAGNK